LASARGVISGAGRVVLAGLRILFQSLIILWAGLAIYFSNLPWGSARLALAILFVGFCIWAFWISRSRRASWAGYALFASVVVWWIAIPPSHDRPWRPEVAVMPRAQIDGDTVRPEVGEGFDPLAANFKQFELIYVVGEERDLVGSRVIHRPEHVFLYRLNAPPEDAQRLFKVYLKRINELADRPEWYHLLSNSCTINIIRYLRAIGRPRGFDIRHYLNGWVDGYLYDSGRLTTDLPFEEMRPESLIDDEVRAAIDAPEFSQDIRAGLPTAGPPIPAPARQQAQ
jgi:hypothetical protein